MKVKKNCTHVGLYIPIYTRLSLYGIWGGAVGRLYMMDDRELGGEITMSALLPLDRYH